MSETTTKLIIDGDPNGLVAAVTKGRAAVGQLETGVLSMNRSILGSTAAVGAFAYGLREVTQAANQTVSANMGLATTARFAGAGIEAANQAAKDLTKDGLMSVTEASRGLQNLLGRGFSLPEAITLMERFKDSAAFNRQASNEFGEAIVKATEGLKNENSILVDNAGVTKNVSVMWKEYAAEISVGVGSLTQSQKRHAELNGIIRETEGQLGNAARMSDSFAGAQARSAQQVFELKSSLGVALQPALTATLSILSPVVGGLRDMVYWVETLGARAAATYDRLKLRAEIALSGKGMFSKEGLAEFEERSKGITAALDETISGIIKRSMGAVAPDIGADNGKRRQDTIIPPKPGKPPKAAKVNLGADADGPMQAYYTEQADLKKIYAEMEEDARAHNVYMMNALGEMSPAQQKAFDASATISNWAAKNAETERQAAAQQAMFESPELARIQQEQDAWEQSWAMRTDSEAIYDERMTLIRQRGTEQRTELERRHAQVVTGLQRSALNSGVELLQVFAGKSRIAALASLTLQKGLAMGETFVSGKAAEIRALAELGPVAGPPMAATIEAWTLTNMGLIAATGIAQAAMGGGAGGTGGGTSGSPIVTQPAGGAAQNGGLNITVQIEGNVISDDRWVEERLAPAIKDLATNRNVSFGFATV